MTAYNIVRDDNLDDLKKVWDELPRNEHMAVMVEAARHKALRCLKWMLARDESNDELALSLIDELGDDSIPIINVIDAHCLSKHGVRRAMYRIIVDRGYHIPDVIKKLAFRASYHRIGVNTEIILALLERGDAESCVYVMNMCVPFINADDVCYGLHGPLITQKPTTVEGLIKRTELAIKTLPDWVLVRCGKLSEQPEFYAVVGKMFAEHMWMAHEHKDLVEIMQLFNDTYHPMDVLRVELKDCGVVGMIVEYKFDD